MTFVVLDPNSTGSNTGAVTGTNAHSALSDGSDSTFVDYDYGEASTHGLSDLTLPSGARLLSAQVLARTKKLATGPGALNTVLVADTTSQSALPVTWDTATDAGGVFSFSVTDPGLDAATIGLYCTSLSSVRVYKAWVRVLYLTKPTVNVTAPTGTLTSSNVQVSWSPSFDVHANTSGSLYEVKVFSQAQYSAGGFDPETSASTISASGSDGSTGVLFGPSLTDGSYRAYVKVASPTVPDQWSDWDYEAFTVDVDKPGTPSLSLAANDADGRIAIELDDTAGDVSTSSFQVQRSVGDESYEGFVAGLDCSLLLPLGSAGGLTDASGNGRNGTAVGGVTVGGVAGPLMVGDEGATDFDGTDDRITTTYATRRNLCTNPRAGAGATTGWGAGTNGFDTFEALASLPTTSGLPTSFPAKCFRFVGSTTGDRAEMSLTGLTNGAQYTVVAYVRLTSLSATDVSLRSVTASAGTAWTAVGGSFTAKSFTFTASGTTETIRLFQNGSGACEGHMTAVLIEAGSSVGTYFDGSGYVEGSGAWVDSSGVSCGWLGTAHASASDIGCFANGTSRTFMGWAWRDTSSSADTLLGGSAASVMVRLDSSGNNLSFFPSSAGAGSTWTSAWPGNGEWVHWALTFNEATDTANLYINGEFVSAKTNAVQFPAGAANLQIAARANEFFDGKLAWVSVHGRALSSEEIQGAFVSADGSSWTNVRTELGDGMVAFPGSAVTVYDYEAPNGVTCTYRARAANHSVVSYSAYATDTESWSSNAFWLKSAAHPSLNWSGVLRSYQSSQIPGNQGVFRGLGSENATVVSDVSGPESGDIVVMSDDDSAREGLASLLRVGEPVLIQAVGSPDRWVSIGDRGSDRVAEKSWIQEHDETLSWTVVDRPDGTLAE